MKRMFSFLLLALVLALTSQSMAVARGASAATGQMVLCTGTGPVVVYVDAEGQPTSAPHICPDAALNVLVDLEMSAPSAPRSLVLFDPDRNSLVTPAPFLPRPVPPSRGPPLFV